MLVVQPLWLRCVVCERWCGLKQSAKQCYDVLKAHISSEGFLRVDKDHGVLFRGAEDDYIAITVHMDDLLLFRSCPCKDQGGEDITSSEFKMTDLGPCEHFLGLTVDRDRQLGTLRITQSTYSKEVLHRLGMSDCNTVLMRIEGLLEVSTSNEDPQLTVTYASTVGSLNYAMTQTRPDLANSVSSMASSLNGPKQEHWQAAQRSLRYLKGTID